MKAKLYLIILVFTCLTLNAQTTYTWDYVSSLQNEWLQKICTQGLDTVYIVGKNGLIAQSTDRALTWKKQYPVTIQLNDIIFCNHTTDFAVGNNGTILRTTDAGNTWTQLYSGTTSNLNAIAATGPDNIWTVGDNGIILFSKDNGDTWHVKDLSTTTRLNDISFRNDLGYIVGNNSIIYKTTDYGKNWSNLALPKGNNLVVQQTENKNLYVLSFDEDRYQWNINFNGDVYPMDYNTSCFYAINDSIGISGAFLGIPTGAGSSYARMRLCKYGSCLSEINIQIPLQVSFDEYHCDINVINDTLGYVASGECLFRINKKDNGMGLNLPCVNDQIELKDETDYLKVVSKNHLKVIEINIMSFSGITLCKQKGDEINTSNLPCDSYIVNIIFENKNYTLKKWMKQKHE